MFRFAIAVHFLSKNNQRVSKIRQNKTPKSYSTVSFAPPPIKLFLSHLYHCAYYSVSTLFYTDSDREARDSLIFSIGRRRRAEARSATAHPETRSARPFSRDHTKESHTSSEQKKQVRVDQSKSTNDYRSYLRNVHRTAITIISALAIPTLESSGAAGGFLGVGLVIDGNGGGATLALVATAWRSLQLAHEMREVVVGDATTFVGPTDAQDGGFTRNDRGSVLAHGVLELGAPSQEVRERHER
jgi:hypothetical protein